MEVRSRAKRRAKHRASQRCEADGFTPQRGLASLASPNQSEADGFFGFAKSNQSEVDCSKQKFAIHKILVIAIKILCLFLI
jgi:hypothetical protein